MRSAVQIGPDPPDSPGISVGEAWFDQADLSFDKQSASPKDLGAIAQLGERLLCTQEVRSSTLLVSTRNIPNRISSEMMVFYSECF